MSCQRWGCYEYNSVPGTCFCVDISCFKVFCCCAASAITACVVRLNFTVSSQVERACVCAGFILECLSTCLVYS